MDFDSEIVTRVRRGAIRIPPYPAIAMQLSRVLREPRHGLAEVVAVVRGDVALAGAILRVANSAVYAGVSSTTNLASAVGRIGEAELVRLAMASSLAADASRAGPLGRIRRHIWHDSIAAAVCCELIAPPLGLDPGELFLAGLFHDVGRMVTLNALEDVLKEHPGEPARKAFEWWAVVERFHVELGLVLAAHWKLPPLFADCISQHHCPAPAGEFRAHAAAVAAADRVVEQLTIGTSLNGHGLRRLVIFEDLTAYDRVAAGLARLPSLVAAFENGPERAGPTKVLSEPPSVTSVPPIDPITFRVKGKGEVHCRSATAATVAFTSPDPMPENFLQELTVSAGGEPFSLWVRVARCERGADGAFEIEGRTFALGGKELARWQALVNRSSHDAA